jgi:hypothetical protein
MNFSFFIVLIALTFQQAFTDNKLIIKQMPSYFLYDNPKGESLKLSEFKNLILATSGVSVNKVNIVLETVFFK